MAGWVLPAISSSIFFFSSVTVIILLLNERGFLGVLIPLFGCVLALIAMVLTVLRFRQCKLSRDLSISFHPSQYLTWVLRILGVLISIHFVLAAVFSIFFLHFVNAPQSLGTSGSLLLGNLPTKKLGNTRGIGPTSNGRRLVSSLSSSIDSNATDNQVNEEQASPIQLSSISAPSKLSHSLHPRGFKYFNNIISDNSRELSKRSPPLSKRQVTKPSVSNNNSSRPSPGLFSVVGFMTIIVALTSLSTSICVFTLPMPLKRVGMWDNQFPTTLESRALGSFSDKPSLGPPPPAAILSAGPVTPSINPQPNLQYSPSPVALDSQGRPIFAPSPASRFSPVPHNAPLPSSPYSVGFQESNGIPPPTYVPMEFSQVVSTNIAAEPVYQSPAYADTLPMNADDYARLAEQDEIDLMIEEQRQLMYQRPSYSLNSSVTPSPLIPNRNKGGDTYPYSIAGDPTRDTFASGQLYQGGINNSMSGIDFGNPPTDSLGYNNYADETLRSDFSLSNLKPNSIPGRQQSDIPSNRIGGKPLQPSPLAESGRALIEQIQPMRAKAETMYLSEEE